MLERGSTVGGGSRQASKRGVHGVASLERGGRHLGIIHRGRARHFGRFARRCRRFTPIVFTPIVVAPTFVVLTGVGGAASATAPPRPLMASSASNALAPRLGISDRTCSR